MIARVLELCGGVVVLTMMGLITGSQGPAEQPGSIQGIVELAGTDSAIAGAPVIARRALSGQYFATTTDEEGAFRFDDVEYGPITIGPGPGSYQGSMQAVVKDDGDTARIVLAVVPAMLEDPWASGLMPRAQSVCASEGSETFETAGLVRDTLDGRVHEDVIVSLADRSCVLLTDEHGRFRLVLPADTTVELRVQYIGYEERSIQVSGRRGARIRHDIAIGIRHVPLSHQE